MRRPTPGSGETSLGHYQVQANDHSSAATLYVKANHVGTSMQVATSLVIGRVELSRHE